MRLQRFVQPLFPALVGLLLAGSALPTGAVEITLQTANDPISGSDRPDDLYTAALGLDLSFAKHRWTLGERMFTDRERGLRFDETFLEATRELSLPAGWLAEVSGGVLHVGHGLLGEGAQNEVHRWVGSERVELPYIADAHWYATGRLRLTRELVAGSRAIVATRVEAAAAPGFQRSLEAELLGDLRLGGEVVLRAGLGLRAGRAESSLLAGVIDELGPTYELGVAWRALTLRLSYNDDGTETQHLTLAVRVGKGSGGVSGRE